MEPPSSPRERSAFGSGRSSVLRLGCPHTLEPLVTNESAFSTHWHDFLNSWGRELQSKLDRVSHLLGDVHRPSEGSYREILFRQLLRRVLPGRFRVSTGFVVGWG